jgi:hypothetical protein
MPKVVAVMQFEVAWPAGRVSIWIIPWVLCDVAVS